MFRILAHAAAYYFRRLVSWLVFVVGHDMIRAVMRFFCTMDWGRDISR